MLTDLIHNRSWVSAPELSPDGRRTAFVVSTIDLDDNTTRSRVWLAGEHSDPAPLTAGPHDGQPQWSPDGRFLAFTSKRGEKDDEATLHVLPVGGPGEVRTVATLKEGFSGPRWSPDGRLIAFTSRTPDKRYDAKGESWQPPRKIETFFTRLNGEGWVFDRPEHIYVVASDGTSAPRNLTPGPYQHGSVAWLPDSSAVVTSGARHEDWDRDLTEDLFLVPLDGGEPRPLTHRTGDYSHPSVSPDGTRVAFLGNHDALIQPQNSKVGVLPLDGSGQITWVSTELDRTFAPSPGARAPIWTDDATLLASAEDRGELHIYRLSADGSTAPERVTSGPVVVQGFSAANGSIAMAQATVERPTELVTLDGQATHVTTSYAGWEKFAVPCTDGSGEVDAWIMKPRDFDPAKTYPVLLNVHGGPFTQFGEQFFDEAQLQAAAGFVVLMSNPRGGSGRDTAWGQSIVGADHPAQGAGWGSVDVDDLIAVLDHALATYAFCDRNRVGMLGGSYGGYMATLLATRFSDRFRAVCSERAVNNMTTLEHSSDIASAFQGFLGVDVAHDPETYAAISPVHQAAQIDIPFLIIHADNDLRCPVGQAEELFVLLRLLGKDVTFYRFPGEDHELSRNGSPVHRKMRAEIILDFFTENLRAR